jgi:hypothetical protein
VGIVHYEGAKGGDEKVRESGSGGEAIVAMVKSADLRNGDHLAVVRRPDRARIRAVFGK